MRREARESARAIWDLEERRGHRHPHPAVHSTRGFTPPSKAPTPPLPGPAAPTSSVLINILRGWRRGQRFLLRETSEHHPGMWQTLVQAPKGYVYSVQHKHTSPGSSVLRRNALSHFVEINTKFMLSQIRVCLAHIRPTISVALALLQGLAGVGIHPSARVSGAAGESQGCAWGSIACMGIRGTHGVPHPRGRQAGVHPSPASRRAGSQTARLE